MDLGLQEKSAVVLASTTGLGFAVARSLCGEGARVAISGRDRGRLETALSELASFGDRIWGETLDVTDAAALKRHFEAANERGRGLQILVVNAGGPPPASALELDDEGLDASFDLTVLA